MSITAPRSPTRSVDESIVPESSGPSPVQEASSKSTFLDPDWRYFSSYLDRAFLSELRRFAFRHTGSYQEAREVVQDVLLRTTDSFHKLRRTTPAVISKYLRTAIKNEVIDRARRRQCESKTFPPEHHLDANGGPDGHPSPIEGPHQAAQFATEIDLIWRSLEAVRPASRRVAIYKILWGYSVGEIAKKLKIKPKTVRNHLNLAKRQFKEFFLREGGTYGAE